MRLGRLQLSWRAGRFIRAREKGRAGLLATVAILANIVALGYFKYANFLIEIANDMAGRGACPTSTCCCPSGISFYTFVQIGYLLDCYGGAGGAPADVGALTPPFAAFFPAGHRRPARAEPRDAGAE